MRLIRRLDKWLLIHGMRSMDGLVVLTPPLADDFAPGVPSIVVEAMVRTGPATEAAESAAAQAARSEHFTVMYAGGLLEEYGVGRLLEAFAHLPEPDYRLWLFGTGTMEREVRAACQRDSRITYWGFVANDEVVRKAREATVLANARPSDQWFTKYSFPSKLVEYMMSGRVVVSTKLPGIPKEYHRYLCLIEDETPSGLAAVLRQLHETPRSELDRRGREAAAFVKEVKNHLIQGERIWRFLQHVAGSA